MLRSRFVRAVLPVLVGASFSAVLAAPPAAVSPLGEEVRSLNGEALRLQSEARLEKSPVVQARAEKALERRQKAYSVRRY